MPELPEVEVLCRSLTRSLVEETIVGVDVRRTDLREEVDVAALRSTVADRRVVSLRRRAKYLLIELDGGAAVVVHLGMSGRLTLVDGEEPTAEHEHVAFLLESGRRLRFVDPRRFGLLFATALDDIDEDPHFAHLGCDPLADRFSGELLERRASGRRTAVKSFLMDATVVVGLGNIYACEALFAAGVHPTRSVARIASHRWDRLAVGTQRVLRSAIAEGGTTLSDYVDGDGQSGYFQVSLSVYGRDGEACRRCDGTIRRRRQSGRSTFYCPGCQT